MDSHVASMICPSFSHGKNNSAQEGDPHTEGEETYLTADMREEFEQLKEEPARPTGARCLGCFFGWGKWWFNGI